MELSDETLRAFHERLTKVAACHYLFVSQTGLVLSKDTTPEEFRILRGIIKTLIKENCFSEVKEIYKNANDKIVVSFKTGYACQKFQRKIKRKRVLRNSVTVEYSKSKYYSENYKWQLRFAKLSVYSCMR